VCWQSEFDDSAPDYDPMMPAKLEVIVVGTDNSGRAQTAVEYAADLAEAVGAALRIVTVHRVLPAGYSFTPYTLFPMPSERDEADALDAHLSYLKPVAQRLHGRGLDVQVRVVTGDPASVLVNSAVELAADLVVVGDRGLRGLRGLFGSVSKAVIRDSKVPVLVVRTG
jgi:nucleotide-binding universal stress UspA family protein